LRLRYRYLDFALIFASAGISEIRNISELTPKMDIGLSDNPDFTENMEKFEACKKAAEIVMPSIETYYIDIEAVNKQFFQGGEL
jgi:hypothetical protein